MNRSTRKLYRVMVRPQWMTRSRFFRRWQWLARRPWRRYLQWRTPRTRR